MSRVEYVKPDPLKFDGSNYQTWSSYFFNYFRACGPHVEQVVVASISPSDNSMLSKEEKVKWVQLNAQVTYLLFSAVNDEVQRLIMNKEDAHLVWTTLKQRYDKSKRDDQDLIITEPQEESSNSEKRAQVDQGEDHKDLTLAVTEKPEVPVLETGCSGFGSEVAEDDIKLEDHARHRPSEESTSSSHQCFMSKNLDLEDSDSESDSDDEDFEFEFEKMTKEDKARVIKIMKRVIEQEEEIERQEKSLNENDEEIKSLSEELEKFKISHASLVCKYGNLENELSYATNSLSCVAHLEKANQALKAQLEELTSKHVALQTLHMELSCSNEKLVESHAMLEVAHEVVITTVKSHQPPTHNNTHSQAIFDLSCANPCCKQGKQSSVGYVLVESCDDALAKENEKLKQEVENLMKDLTRLKGKSNAQPSQDNRETMVKKLEKGSTVQSSCKSTSKSNMSKPQAKKRKLDHIKCFKCSNMGHYASMCSSKVEGQQTLSKRQRSLAKRRCFGCCEKGHKIATCPSKAKVLSGKTGGSGFTKPEVPVLPKQHHFKLNKGFKKAQEKYLERKIAKNQENKIASNLKHKICYSCRGKGHLGKDCPNGNTPKLNLVHNNYVKLRKSSDGTCASKVISSPSTRTKAIWVPKSLLTNFQGPNIAWVPKCA